MKHKKSENTASITKPANGNTTTLPPIPENPSKNEHKEIHAKNENTVSNNYITIFKWIVFFFFLYALPLILADVLYKDDIRRVMYGDPSTWYRDGRPLMAYILTAFSFGTPLVDTSPLPLLAGILILSFSMALFYKKYLHNYDNLSAVLCLLMLIISPFFLENLSFKFESLGMCITLALIIILFSLPDHISKPECFLLSGITSICISCIYQATMGAFFSFLFFTAFIELKETTKDSTLKQYLEKAFYKTAGFCLGTLFYMGRIAPYFVAKDGYQAEHSQIIPFTAEGLTKFYKNLKGFLDYLQLMYFPDSKAFITYLSGAVIITAIIATVLYIKDIFAARQDKTKYYKACFVLIAPFLIICFAFLPMCILTNPNYMPRAFLSFNIFLLFIGFLLITLSKKRRLILLIFIPVYFFSYSFSYAYANLLKSQADFEDHVAQSIVYDLNKINGIDSSYRFFVEGKRIVAKDVSLATKRYSIFSLMIPNNLRKDYVFTGHLLSRYSTYRITTDNLKKYNPENYKTVTHNSLYRIMQNKKNIVIEFIYK